MVAGVEPILAEGGAGEPTDVTPHTLRHSVAYRSIPVEGGRQEAVQMQLGHVNRRTTDEIYSHLIPRYGVCAALKMVAKRELTKRKAARAEYIDDYHFSGPGERQVVRPMSQTAPSGSISLIVRFDDTDLLQEA